MAEGGSRGPGFAFFIVNDGSNGNNFQGATGSEADMDYFRAIFEIQLGFQWKNDQYLNRNLTLAQWDHRKTERRHDTQNLPAHPEQCCMICLLKTLDFTGVEYIVIGISTHGADVEGNALVQLFDGTFMYVDDIMYALSDKKIPALRGTKKILVCNACRIDDSKEKAEDRGAAINVIENNRTGIEPMETEEEPSHTQPLSKSKGSLSPKPRPRTRRLERLNSLHTSNIPQLGDFLIVYAAPPGRMAKTNSRNGSWMLQALNDVVAAHDFYRPLNFLQALTKAANIMSQRETIVRDRDGRMDPLESGKKNTLYFSSTLTSLPLFTRPARQDPAPELLVAGQIANRRDGPVELPANYSLFGNDARDPQRRNDQTQPKMI